MEYSTVIQWFNSKGSTVIKEDIIGLRKKKQREKWECGSGFQDGTDNEGKEAKNTLMEKWKLMEWVTAQWNSEIIAKNCCCPRF